MRKHTEDEGLAGDGLWEGILRETATEARSPDATMLLLGRPGVGKRTLVQALLQHACPHAAAADAAADVLPEGKNHSRAVAVDYAYFGARDPAANDEASANDFVCPSAFSVVILEDSKHEGLLRSRLQCTPEMLRHTVAVVCLDLKEPWTMMEDLRCWIELLQRLTADIFQQLELGDQDSLRARIADALSAYREPEITEETKAAGEPAAEGGKEKPNDGASVLTYNLGIPLIVAVTRADGASALESQKTVGWSETIEAYLRSECLSYGAAIVYTMVQTKNVSNVDVLYDVLMHRIYDYPLKRGATLPSRDALFIPSGWDTQAKVDAIVAAMPGGHGLERSFESVVVSLEPSKPSPPQFHECKSMQEFLKESANLLPKTGSAPAATPSSSKPETGVEPKAQPGQRRVSGDPNALGQRTSTMSNRTEGPAPAANAMPPTDNTSLANFFQTLLTRGQKEGGARPPLQTGGGLSAEAALNAPKAAAPSTGAASAPAPSDAAAPATAPS